MDPLSLHDLLFIQGRQETDMATLKEMVLSHERTIQRLLGAVALTAALGLGTLGLVLLRIAGVLP